MTYVKDVGDYEIKINQRVGPLCHISVEKDNKEVVGGEGNLKERQFISDIIGETEEKVSREIAKELSLFIDKVWIKKIRPSL